MYNDSYSIEELLAELSQELGVAVGTANEVGRAVLTRYEVQSIIAKLYANKKTLPEGKNVVIGGEVAYQIGGFISWD